MTINVKIIFLLSNHAIFCFHVCIQWMVTTVLVSLALSLFLLLLTNTDSYLCLRLTTNISVLFRHWQETPISLAILKIVLQARVSIYLWLLCVRALLYQYKIVCCISNWRWWPCCSLLQDSILALQDWNSLWCRPKKAATFVAVCHCTLLGELNII